ncbi:hypothetical protein K2X30_08605 [bacterium]|nr:hypothetical protein [bacterium]
MKRNFKKSGALLTLGALLVAPLYISSLSLAADDLDLFNKAPAKGPAAPAAPTQPGAGPAAPGPEAGGAEQPQMVTSFNCGFAAAQLKTGKTKADLEAQNKNQVAHPEKLISDEENVLESAIPGLKVGQVLSLRQLQRFLNPATKKVYETVQAAQADKAEGVLVPRFAFVTDPKDPNYVVQVFVAPNLETQEIDVKADLIDKGADVAISLPALGFGESHPIKVTDQSGKEFEVGYERSITLSSNIKGRYYRLMCSHQAIEKSVYEQMQQQQAPAAAPKK